MSSLDPDKRQDDHINAVYVSILHKMVQGSYMLKPGTFLYDLSNETPQCNTKNTDQFIFMAHVIRGKNNRIKKRLLFNDDSKEKNCDLGNSL